MELPPEWHLVRMPQDRLDQSLPESTKLLAQMVKEHALSLMRQPFKFPDSRRLFRVQTVQMRAQILNLKVRHQEMVPQTHLSLGCSHTNSSPFICPSSPSTLMGVMFFDLLCLLCLPTFLKPLLGSPLACSPVFSVKPKGLLPRQPQPGSSQVLAGLRLWSFRQAMASLLMLFPPLNRLYDPYALELDLDFNRRPLQAQDHNIWPMFPILYPPVMLSLTRVHRKLQNQSHVLKIQLSLHDNLPRKKWAIMKISVP